MASKLGIILLSGGIDSTVLLADLSNNGYKLHALSFDYGQRHLVELDYAKANATKYGVLSHKVVRLDNQLFAAQSSLTNTDLMVSVYGKGSLPTGTTDAYVPCRNMLFLSNATGYAETISCLEVFVAFNKDDAKNFPDCTPVFVEAFNNLVASQFPPTKAPKIVAPFLSKTKTEIIQLATKLGVDISNTLTCYSPNGNEECGVCLSCSTKKTAISEIGSSN